jgi:putative endonuclease
LGRTKSKGIIGIRKLSICNQNYHSRYGEIDLIVRSGKELVFVEVKARSSGSYATACEVITRAQQRKIIKTAQFFYKNILIMMILIVVLM